MLSCHNSLFYFAFCIVKRLEFVGEDNVVTLKMIKEFLKLKSTTFKLFHQFLKHNRVQDASLVKLFLGYFFLFHVDKWIIDANKGNHLILINSKNLIERRMVKIKFTFFAAVGVDHHNLS